MVQGAIDDQELHDRSDLIPLRAYVENVLGLKLRLRAWAEVGLLPYVLRERYELFVTQILSIPCLILKERAPHKAGVADVAKHMLAIKKLLMSTPSDYKDFMIFVTDSLPSYDRKRMIEKGVQFIVPGNQLYLPAFGMDLREYFRQRLNKPTALSPATQSILIRYLNVGWDPQYVVARASFEQTFNYSKMTVTRAIKELADLGIVHRLKQDGEAGVGFHLSPRQTWEMAKEYLRTPVRRTLWLDAIPKAHDLTLLLAGEAALAERSLLANPTVPCFATTTEQFHIIRENATERRGDDFGAWGRPQLPGGSKFGSTSPYVEVPAEHAACCVQFWSYAPQPGSSEPRSVDPFSLYVSLKDHPDDRVQICLDEMMENMEW